MHHHHNNQLQDTALSRQIPTTKISAQIFTETDHQQHRSIFLHTSEAANLGRHLLRPHSGIYDLAIQRLQPSTSDFIHVFDPNQNLQKPRLAPMTVQFFFTHMHTYAFQTCGRTNPDFRHSADRTRYTHYLGCQRLSTGPVYYFSAVTMFIDTTSGCTFVMPTKFHFFFQSSTNLLSADTKLTNANVVSVRGCGIELAEQQELQNADNKISSKDELYKYFLANIFEYVCNIHRML